MAAATLDDQGFDLIRPHLDRHEPAGHLFSSRMPQSTRAERDQLRAALRAAATTHPAEVAALRAYFNSVTTEEVPWRRDVRAAIDYLAGLNR